MFRSPLEACSPLKYKRKKMDTELKENSHISNVHMNVYHIMYDDSSSMNEQLRTKKK